MPKKSLTSLMFFFLIISTTLLSLNGCGLSGERGGTNGRTANNQPGSGSDRNDEEEGHFDSKEKIRIEVERLNGVKNSVDTKQISIVSLNENFQETGSASTPSYRVINSLKGGYEIQFSAQYIEKTNQVVKVIINNTSTPKEILYAPLYTVISDSFPIKVNAKSHYVLKKLFDNVNTQAELEQLNCESDSGCSNQGIVKANLLRQLNEAIAGYTITLPSGSNVTSALNYIDSLTEIRTTVEQSILEITRSQSPIAKGTRRAYDPLNSAGPYSQAYNTVFFGLALSDIIPNDDKSVASISSVSSKPSDQTYPNFTQTTTMYDLRKDVLSFNIPFDRTTLIMSENGSLNLLSNENTNFLTYSFKNDSNLSTQGHLLNQRGFLQSTPNGTSGSNMIGWEFSPVMAKQYQVNEFEPPILLEDRNKTPNYGNAPTWLTSANYINASKFSLTGTKVPFTRTQFLEDKHIFSWEINGLQVNKTPGLSMSTLNGKDYGAISYSLRLDNTSSTKPISLIAETARWRVTSSSSSSGSITITQPSSHYTTKSLSRSASRQTSGVRTESNLIDSPRTLSLDSAAPFRGLEGLVSISNPGPGKPLGHASADGRYLALSFNTKESSSFDRGQGLIIASELVSGNYLFTNDTYMIQGNSLEINTEQHVLHNFNGSLINLDTISNNLGNNCAASLALQRLSVSHSVDPQVNSVSNPVSSSSPVLFSRSCINNGSELYIEFDGVFGETLKLRGFITQPNTSSGSNPGNLINFIWEQNSQLGLVFANKELDLNPEFD